jgi:hypothetical protein
MDDQRRIQVVADRCGDRGAFHNSDERRGDSQRFPNFSKGFDVERWTARTLWLPAPDVGPKREPQRVAIPRACRL